MIFLYEFLQTQNWHHLFLIFSEQISLFQSKASVCFCFDALVEPQGFCFLILLLFGKPFSWLLRTTQCWFLLLTLLSVGTAIIGITGPMYIGNFYQCHPSNWLNRVKALTFFVVKRRLQKGIWTPNHFVIILNFTPLLYLLYLLQFLVFPLQI